MRKVVGALLGLLAAAGAAENAREYSVQASATVSEAPPRITLAWPQDTGGSPDRYLIFRKAPSAPSWGRVRASLPGSRTSYTDRDVRLGVAYEYQIVKQSPALTGYGYLCAGIKLPMVERRGALLLVVDRTYSRELAFELARLEQDITGDGWTVTRLEVDRTDPVARVKARIKAAYEADPANLKGVFLFGHVPVPYSGDIVPDGHVPEHQGAWPCDGYYGDLDGRWTDRHVASVSASDPRNRNVPGDGKFDQSRFPAPLRLMVGRVDLSNLPGRASRNGPATFPSEVELLRNYLNKDHAFRTKQFDLPRKGVIGDFFGARDGEAYAASGWRNFAGFFGAPNVISIRHPGRWAPVVSNSPYLWAYGCGAGTYTSIGGLGNSDADHDLTSLELYRNGVQAVFTLMFGSWLGDWDSEDNLQRAMLALPNYALTCAWSGRPHWFLHRMALGEPIGFAARLTQNNGPDGLYRNQVNSTAGSIHIALMGDPTLRMHVVAPPAAVNAVTNGNSITLRWTGSPDAVLGYHVYQADAGGTLTRLTGAPAARTAFTIIGEPAANYLVRALKLEDSASGSYYNLSQAAFLQPVVEPLSRTIARAGQAHPAPPRAEPGPGASPAPLRIQSAARPG